MTAEASHRILGTAGHIDHGKTALVRALTGVETDRLPEEKKRGITIELGFAPWPVSDELFVSIIDMPGHERFVRTMVAGASGIDGVLLVVAADDGVMPQTAEHLAVCELLGVERGLVIITKSDLVDEEMLELVQQDAELAVAGTFLEGAPQLACSATTGAGVDEVREAVERLLADAPPRSDAGPVYMPVDRVFTKAGFGTVATGTLLSGVLEAGAELEALPGPRGQPLRGLKGRGLQVHGEATETAHAGVRVAANLRGPDVEALRRGDVVATAGAFEPTGAVHVELRVLDGAPAIAERDELSFHVGTTDRLAKVIPLQDGPLLPGTRGAARVVMDEPVVLFAGQRVVLRKPGMHGQGTVAGGRVLDPHPASGKGSFKRWVALAPRLGAEALEDRLVALVADTRADGASLKELRRRTPPGADLEAKLDELVASGQLMRAGSDGARFVEPAQLDDVKARVLHLVQDFHAQRPLLSGVSPGELETQLPPVLRGLCAPAIQALVDSGELALAHGAVRSSGHDPDAGGAGETRRRVMDLYAGAGLTPPTDDEAKQALGLAEGELKDVLAELKRRGTLARLGPLHFHESAIVKLMGRVQSHLDSEDELTTAQFKELAGGLSRKYAIPLLEHLDAAGVTQRRGDVRVRPPR
jgi:selenocysteine-specific elongation factor